jgi:hypothetical protein
MEQLSIVITTENCKISDTDIIHTAVAYCLLKWNPGAWVVGYRRELIVENLRNITESLDRLWQFRRFFLNGLIYGKVTIDVKRVKTLTIITILITEE